MILNGRIRTWLTDEKLVWWAFYLTLFALLAVSFLQVGPIASYIQDHPDRARFAPDWSPSSTVMQLGTAGVSFYGLYVLKKPKYALFMALLGLVTACGAAYFYYQGYLNLTGR